MQAFEPSFTLGVFYAWVIVATLGIMFSWTVAKFMWGLFLKFMKWVGIIFGVAVAIGWALDEVVPYVYTKYIKGDKDEVLAKLNEI